MALEEEILETEDIQGNILAGFNKDYQAFLFLKMSSDDQAVPATRQWLRWLTPQVSSVAEVASFNRLFRDMRKRQGDDPHGLVATWLNIAFSAAALKRLTTPAAVEEFVDTYFKDGLAARSGALNDPIEPEAGSPSTWVVGGPHNEADMVVIIASDHPSLLADRLAMVRSVLPAELTVLWEQPGETLDPPLTGHEHFGFKDGVSQPGIRGLTQASPPRFLTPRLIDPTQTPQSDRRLPEFAAPGQPLVWPGQFVFGYRRQSHNDARDPPVPPQDIADACPSWGRNGSYLVIRRLRQDVPAFRAFVRQTAETLKSQPGFEDMTPQRFAALCVGRWPSGAPIMRSPKDDPISLGDDPYANNFFQYVKDSPAPPPLLPDAEYAGDTHMTSQRDDKGITCPFSAHVRKVNPRDTTTEQGNSQDVLARLLLRRGIPFGPVYPGDLGKDGPTTTADAEAERGLIFASYQTSIEDQFVFLQANWANHATNPNGSGGQDPMIGQAERQTGGTRTFTVRAAGHPSLKLKIEKEWVIPTGGGFFFSPSISTLVNVLGKDGEAPALVAHAGIRP